MTKKCILILLDGLGDRAYEELNHLTPLQAAKTPTLDRLAAGGANGLYHAAMLGQALPSENAHFNMFGYDMSAFPGRGALEALGAGMELGPTDVAVLAHFVSLKNDKGILTLAQGKPTVPEDVLQDLSLAVEEYATRSAHIRFRRTKGINGILLLSGHVSPFFTDTDPFINGRPLIAVKPWADYKDDKAANNAATAVKDYLTWAHARLKKHPTNLLFEGKGLSPINGLVSQRPGQLKDVQPFRRCYGLRGLSISSGLVYWGLAKYLGMDIHKTTDTGDPAADMAERLKLARAALESYDFIHVHTKAPDQAGHAKDPKAKQSAIESLDSGMGKAIEPLMRDPEVLIIVTSDHSTPSAGQLIHSGEAVPVTFFGQGVRRDQVRQFDEISVATGALGSARGKELMYLILNHLDRTKLQSVMDTPLDQPYWPGDYEPFRLDDDL